jgi:hypothetical protein
MSVRALLFGFVIAAHDVLQRLHSPEPPKAIIHVLDRVPFPPYFYIRIDDRVFAVKLES